MSKNNLMHSTITTYKTVPPFGNKDHAKNTTVYPKENWENDGYTIIVDKNTKDYYMDNEIPCVNECVSVCLCITLITICGGVIYIVLTVMDSTINDNDFVNVTNITNITN